MSLERAQFQLSIELSKQGPPQPPSPPKNIKVFVDENTYKILQLNVKGNVLNYKATFSTKDLKLQVVFKTKKTHKAFYS